MVEERSCEEFSPDVGESHSWASQTQKYKIIIKAVYILFNFSFLLIIIITHQLSIKFVQFFMIFKNSHFFVLLINLKEKLSFVEAFSSIFCLHFENLLRNIVINSVQNCEDLLTSQEVSFSCSSSNFSHERWEPIWWEKKKN